MNKETLQRFWSRVDKDGPAPAHCPWLGPCWVWTAGKTKGYGEIRVDGKQCTAHRVSWELAHGAIPPGPGAHGTCVLHHCDNPACVRPDHLWLGSNAENLADMVAKGRGNKPKGEAHGSAKLDEVDVRLMRRLSKQGLKQAVLGQVFGVTQQAVSKVCSGKRWRHVA